MAFLQREHGQTVALDIAHGLGYLHSQGLVHGRLKSTNVLMNKAGVAKISDVALPKLLSHCKTAPADISRWPEVSHLACHQLNVTVHRASFGNV